MEQSNRHVPQAILRQAPLFSPLLSAGVLMLAAFCGNGPLTAQEDELPQPFSSRRTWTRDSQDPRSKPALGKEEFNFGKITIGTPRHRVRELLGPPTLESLIPSLRRLREWYKDDTEVTFVEGKVISVIPGKRIHCGEDGSYFIELEKKTVAVAPTAMRKCGEFLPDEKYKCAIETQFWFAPTVFIPTAYDGTRFTPPLAHGPYVRSYLMQFGTPHFFWPQKFGYDWCVRCRRWHPYSAAAGTHIPRLGSGYYSFGAPY